MHQTVSRKQNLIRINKKQSPQCINYTAAENYASPAFNLKTNQKISELHNTNACYISRSDLMKRKP